MNVFSKILDLISSRATVASLSVALCMQQSVEASSRDHSREPSRDRSREPSRDRPTGGQRVSSVNTCFTFSSARRERHCVHFLLRHTGFAKYATRVFLLQTFTHHLSSSVVLLSVPVDLFPRPNTLSDDRQRSVCVVAAVGRLSDIRKREIWTVIVCPSQRSHDTPLTDITVHSRRHLWQGGSSSDWGEQTQTGLKNCFKHEQFSAAVVLSLVSEQLVSSPGKSDIPTVLPLALVFRPMNPFPFPSPSPSLSLFHDEFFDSNIGGGRGAENAPPTPHHQPPHGGANRPRWRRPLVSQGRNRPPVVLTVPVIDGSQQAKQHETQQAFSDGEVSSGCVYSRRDERLRRPAAGRRSCKRRRRQLRWSDGRWRGRRGGADSRIHARGGASDTTEGGT